MNLKIIMTNGVINATQEVRSEGKGKGHVFVGILKIPKAKEQKAMISEFRAKMLKRSDEDFKIEVESEDDHSITFRYEDIAERSMPTVGVTCNIIRSIGFKTLVIG